MAAPGAPPWHVLLLACVGFSSFATATNETTSSIWPACASSCSWQAVAFTANSTEATEAYKGCERSVPQKFRKGVESDKPSLIIIGVQKGGTTSIRFMANRLPFLCFSSDVEPHFWDQWDYAKEAPSLHVLRYEYFQKQWKGACKDGQDKVEKTPDIFHAAWGPLRMCEALGRQKLALFLRNPVDRAFSGFLQTFPPMVKSLTRSAKSFDMYARIEVALVKECPSLPTGFIAEDQKRSRAFKECCLRVTKGFHPELTSPWPACSCPRKGKYCTMFGDRTANAVRRGIYASWVRMWLRYHRAEDLLIIKAEDFFQTPLRVESELACFIRPQQGCEKVETKPVHANSATKKLHMWKKTRDMLTEFYTPYNVELEQLLGRPMNWW